MKPTGRILRTILSFCFVFCWSSPALALDTDGDGMQDDWEVDYGLNPLDPGDAAADSDVDGYSNLEEFIGETDPRDELFIPNSATALDGQAQSLRLVAPSGVIITDFHWIDPATLPTSPSGSFPFGLVSLHFQVLQSGETVTVAVTFPANVDPESTYYQYGPTSGNTTYHWYPVPYGSKDGDTTIILTLTDGSDGDHDLTANGVIVDFGGPTLSSSLAAISTRAHVLTGADVAIGGFVISGTEPKAVLIKARGPSMSGTPYHVPGTLADPLLQVYDTTAMIAQNDNWRDQSDPTCSKSGYSCGSATEITATGIDPCNPNPGQSAAPPDCGQESALLMILPPGAYTAIERGMGNTSGVGRVEVYEMNTSTVVNLSLTPFAQGLNGPVGIYNAGSEDDRLFVIEQAGVIKIVRPDGTILPAPFLDITDRVDSSDNEVGLLGLAFHPEYSTNGFFYVNYTHTSEEDRRTRISRFSVTGDPNVADPTSEVILLTVDQPFLSHKAGDIRFGPDSYLYIPLGDGGSAGDPKDYAQNNTTLLGKITRIDVDSGSGTSPDCKGQGTGDYTIPPSNPLVDGAGNTCDEIWAIGLRNPWRSSFDRVTGDFYFGDVGQNTWEEINFQPADSFGGDNYGWRCYEGNHPYNLGRCRPPGDYTLPIFEYPHGNGECAVISGYVYRGSQSPALYGRYLLTDYCTGHFWDLVPNGAGGWRATEHTPLSTFGFVSFGEDSTGELYVVNAQNGILYRLQGN